MTTFVFILIIFLNTLIGTIPIAGPFISGIVAGVLIGKKELAPAVAFWGAIIGGVLCRTFLSYPHNVWHRYLLTIFGNTMADYFQNIINGNHFYLVLYFGLINIAGAYLGVFIKNRLK